MSARAALLLGWVLVAAGCRDPAPAPVSWAVPDAVLTVEVAPAVFGAAEVPLVSWLTHEQGLFAAEVARARALWRDLGLDDQPLAEVLDPAVPVRLWRRSTGDVLVGFTAKESLAAAKLLATGWQARGLTLDEQRGVFTATDQAGRVVLVGRRDNARVIAFVSPQDPVLAQSHLAALPPGPAPPMPDESLVHAQVRAAQGPVSELWLALLDGATSAALTVPRTGPAVVRLVLAEPLAPAAMAHRFCRDAPDEVFRGALPATLVAADERLQGAVALRLFRPGPDDAVRLDDPLSYGPFYLSATPRSDEAAASLRASFAAGARPVAEAVGDETVWVHVPPDGAAHRTLRGVFGPGRFVLSNLDPARFSALLAEETACAPRRDMVLDGPAVFGALAAPAPGDPASSAARVRRVFARVFAGAGRVTADVEVDKNIVQILFHTAPRAD